MRKIDKEIILKDSIKINNYILEKGDKIIIFNRKNEWTYQTDFNFKYWAGIINNYGQYDKPKKAIIVGFEEKDELERFDEFLTRNIKRYGLYVVSEENNLNMVKNRFKKDNIPIISIITPTTVFTFPDLAEEIYYKLNK